MSTTVSAGEAFFYASDCYPSIPALQEEFDVFGVIDFCTGIDAAVLHERIYTPTATLDEDIKGNWA